MQVIDPESILGFDVTRANRDACVDRILSWVTTADGATPHTVCCVNPHSILTARRDAEFASALRGADLCVPDGIGIVRASRILGGRVRARITGSDLFEATMRRIAGRSCFLLGADAVTLDAMAARIARDTPSVRVAGRYAPPRADTFPDDENRRMVAAVNAVSPDILWIGMSQPKQEKWAWRNRGNLRARVVIPVGAVFDFYTGRVRRPGPLAQRLGLEWLVRLSREPRRLWRRNLDSPLFLWLVLAARLSRQHPAEAKQ